MQCHIANMRIFFPNQTFSTHLTFVLLFGNKWCDAQWAKNRKNSAKNLRENDFHQKLKSNLVWNFTFTEIFAHSMTLDRVSHITTHINTPLLTLCSAKPRNVDFVGRCYSCVLKIEKKCNRNILHKIVAISSKYK